jgi:hypothetical protein
MCKSFSFPKFLYRGDSDKNNERKLRQTISSNILLTNLSNGGNGKEILTSDFNQLVNKHIGIGWSKTHFLSFTSIEDKAFYYASKSSDYMEIYDFHKNWDFSILTFSFDILLNETIKEYDKGFYYSEFVPTCKEFYPRFRILLIDCFEFLKNKHSSAPEFKQALVNAERDKEWLILPMNSFGSEGELTSKLDNNCITEKRIFKEL